MTSGTYIHSTFPEGLAAASSSAQQAPANRPPQHHISAQMHLHWQHWYKVLNGQILQTVAQAWMLLFFSMWLVLLSILLQHTTEIS